MNAIWAVIFPLIFLGISTIMFSGSVDDSGLANEIDKIGCPMPSSSGLWNSSGTLQYTNGTYNYEAVGLNIKTLTCSNVHTLDGFDYFYGSPTIPFAGMPFFIGDWLSSGLEKVGAVFGLMGIFLNATVPISLIIEIPLLAIPYAIIFTVLGIGGYLLAHPFKR